MSKKSQKIIKNRKISKRKTKRRYTKRNRYNKKRSKKIIYKKQHGGFPGLGNKCSVSTCNNKYYGYSWPTASQGWWTGGTLMKNQDLGMTGTPYLCPEHNTGENLNEIIAELRQAQGNVYCYIVTSHGSVEGATEMGDMAKLPDNFNLLLYISRSNLALSPPGSVAARVGARRKRGVQILTAIKQAIDSDGPDGLFDGEGCMTDIGKSLLDQLAILLRYGKVVDTTDKIHQVKGKTGNTGLDRIVFGKEWIWNSLYMYLKLYKPKEVFNDQSFLFDKQTVVDEFGIIFMYTDSTGITKETFLPLKPLAKLQQGTSRGRLKFLESDESTHFIIRLNTIFRYITPLVKSTGLQFYFTHGSCRTYDAVDVLYPSKWGGEKLTKQLSDKKEAASIKCFINDFKPEWRDQISRILSRYDTIFEFYDALKGKGLFDTWVSVMKEGDVITHRSYSEFIRLTNILHSAWYQSSSTGEEPISVSEADPHQAHVAEIVEQPESLLDTSAEGADLKMTDLKRKWEEWKLDNNQTEAPDLNIVVSGTKGVPEGETPSWRLNFNMLIPNNKFSIVKKNDAGTTKLFTSGLTLKEIVTLDKSDDNWPHMFKISLTFRGTGDFTECHISIHYYVKGGAGNAHGHEWSDNPDRFPEERWFIYSSCGYIETFYED
jgi:hypothetical protein